MSFELVNYTNNENKTYNENYFENNFIVLNSTKEDNIIRIPKKINNYNINNLDILIYLLLIGQAYYLHKFFFKS